MRNIFYGVLYSIIGQILTFLQLQGNIKYKWYEKHPALLLLASIPISLLFIKSIENFVKAYNGEIWPGRFWGFSIGIVVFFIMSKLLFNEPFNLKTIICLLLSITIVCVQLFWK